MVIRQSAPAKINLCLHVVGQRATDGLHLLESLVVFLDVGEWVEVRKASKTTLKIVGPQATFLSAQDDNLILRAAALFPTECTTEIILHKTMPISSGIGGGSADAAATLRGMAKLWSLDLPSITAQLSLGADVPVCIACGSVWMTGVGEVIQPVVQFPELYAVLVNPGVQVSTARTFDNLSHKKNKPVLYYPSSHSKWYEWLPVQRNDLQKLAIAQVASIEDVLQRLKSFEPLAARMSGSGATCFALFESADIARACRDFIATIQPAWWVHVGAIER